MSRNWFTFGSLTAALAATCLSTSVQASSCPSGFSFVKDNNVFTCTKKISHMATRNAELEAFKNAELTRAERGYRRCGGPLSKPQFIGLVLSFRTNTEFEGSNTGANPGETLQLRGDVTYSCKLE